MPNLYRRDLNTCDQKQFEFVSVTIIRWVEDYQFDQTFNICMNWAFQLCSFHILASRRAMQLVIVWFLFLISFFKVSNPVAPSTTPSALDGICSLAPVMGFCGAGTISLWYFDSQSHSCKMYSPGCQSANANQFQSEADCMNICSSSITATGESFSFNLGRVSVRTFDFVFQTFVQIVIEAVKWQDCASGSFETACLQNWKMFVIISLFEWHCKGFIVVTKLFLALWDYFSLIYIFLEPISGLHTAYGHEMLSWVSK